MDADKDCQRSLLRFPEAHRRRGSIALTPDEDHDVQFEGKPCGNSLTIPESLPTLTPEVFARALAEGRFKIGGEAILQRAIELVGALCDECTEVLGQFVDERGVPFDNHKDVRATKRLFELSNVANNYLLKK
jgi:hypothetical protein